MDFALILLIALVVTGLIWLVDKVAFAPARERVTDAVLATESSAIGGKVSADRLPSEPRIPVLVEYAKALFPVIALVFVLRSFIVEPFRIPSGSMIPTLEVGDFILVNKFVYGIRLPVVNKKIVSIKKPSRGDVMVFRFPVDPKINFIKRVIGLPGDRVVYDKKRLFINDKPVSYESGEEISFAESGSRMIQADQYVEVINEASHRIVVDRGQRGARSEFTVPENKYFVMGDNRDFSNDSRGWGFVPEANIVGKAFFIWFSLDKEKSAGVDWARIGSGID